MLARLADDLVLLGPWKRAAVALAAGGVSALAMAPLHWGFVMFATVPGLVLLLEGAETLKPDAGRLRSSLPAFATGWCFGFGYFVAGLWWIGQAFLVEAEEFAFLLPVAVAGLPALLAIFHGLATVVARALSFGGWTRVPALAFALAGAEWLRGHVLTGFPWNALGYAAMPLEALMQPAAVFGLYGVTLAALLAFAAPVLLLRPERTDVVAFGTIAFGAVALVVGSNMLPLLEQAPDGARIRLVQPAVDQKEKWAPGKAEEMFRRHVALSRAEPLEGLTYVIWPESAFAFLVQREPNALAAIADMLPEGVRLVTGAMRGEDFQGGVPERVWNSVLVIDDEGAIIDSGDKTHLVPFGEYLPFAPVLRALGLRQLVARGGFEAGGQRMVMQATAGPSFLPLICYEVIFPRAVTTENARPDLLLNVTNDGWFGMTPGPYQHAHQARIRGVEQGLPMVRVANSGISFVSDARGRSIATIALGKRDVVDATVPGASRITPYVRFGDWPFGVAMLLTFALLVQLRGRALSSRP